MYCLCWSLGGLLGENERPAFDAELRSIGGSSLPPKYVQSECQVLGPLHFSCRTGLHKAVHHVKLTAADRFLCFTASCLTGAAVGRCRESETDTVFEYLVNEATGVWQHWAGCVPEWTYPYADEEPKFAQLAIPTLDSVRCTGNDALCTAHLTVLLCANTPALDAS